MNKNPVLGGLTSPNDTVVIHSSAFTKGGLYHINTEILAVDHAIVDQSNHPKFDSWWNVDENGTNAYAPYSNQTTNLYNESPLKQFKGGVPSYMITCNLGLVPIMKISDHTPACIKPTTDEILIKRGWGTSIPAGHQGTAPARVSLINKTK